MKRSFVLVLATGLVPAVPGMAAPAWVSAWTGSAQGPYPVGNPTAQPELKFAIPSSDTGAVDQSFRLIVRPDVWGKQARIRLSNAFGDKPVTFDDAYVGLQSSGSMLAPETNHNITFGGKSSVTLAPGDSVTSDPAPLEFVKNAADPMLANRKLAVSFHVVGETGKLTWHAKGLTTSYLSAPKTGAHGGEEGEASYPYSTTSWFFLDALDMDAPDSQAVVAFGDSITDGTASTLNGDDRWVDVLSRRLHAKFGERYSVVNEGIGGNMVSGPDDYTTKPFAGGPSALDRLQRDVISLAQVRSIIWLEGINDFGNAGYDVERASAGVRAGVERLRKSIPGVKIYMGLLTSALNSTNGGYGVPAVEAKRMAYNDFIRKAGIFDGVIDFDTPTRDSATGEMKAEFQPNSTTGGPGDRLHPNRGGYSAMGRAIDIDSLFGQK